MLSKAKNKKSAAPVEMVSVPADALRRLLDKGSREYLSDPGTVRELRQALEAGQGGR